MTGEARATIDAFVSELDGDTRRLADAEWGITVEAAGWPLHVGVAIRDGMVRVQAHVIEAGSIDPRDLLRWNRQIPYVRFSYTDDGEVWIQGELQLVAVSATELDRFLGLLVLSAEQARQTVARPAPAGGGSDR